MYLILFRLPILLRSSSVAIRSTSSPPVRRFSNEFRPTTFWVDTVMHSPDESEVNGHVASVLPNIVPGRRGVALDKVADVTRLGEYIGGMAHLGHLRHHGSTYLEDVFTTEQEDLNRALSQLLVKERIVVRLPAELRHVESGGNPEFVAKVLQLSLIHI